MTDYISKQKAIEEIKAFQAQITIMSSADWENGMMEGFDHAIDVIELMDTVEAEPVRHAHWIWKGDEGDSRFMCSECRCMENAPTCMGVPNIWEYCPNCGARMEEYELERKRTDTGGTDPEIRTGNS